MEKFRVHQTKFWGGLAFVVTVLSFQNCSKARFTFDPAQKASLLQDTNVLGGNDTTINTPGDDGNIKGNVPGDDGQTTGNRPGDDGYTSKNEVLVTLRCTVAPDAHSSTMVSSIQGELKLLITKADQTTVLCQVNNVRKQMERKQKIDISSCPTSIAKDGSNRLLIVGQNVTSNYAANSVVFSDENKYVGKGIYNSHGVLLPYSIGYTTFSNEDAAPMCDGVDPLLVQLHTEKPQKIELSAPQDGVMFDLLGVLQDISQKVMTAWFVSPDSENYFLALPNEKGEVLGAQELFGNATLGPDQKVAEQGFAALAKYDDNQDQVIDSSDEVFAKLRLWKDKNRDGIAQPEELFTLDEKGVIAIDLQFDAGYEERDRHGNIIKYKSAVMMKDRSYGLIYDLWLKFITN